MLAHYYIRLGYDDAPVLKQQRKRKAVPLHAMEALGGEEV
jgi:hypothetical protein